jgi:hypothetical protein
MSYGSYYQSTPSYYRNPVPYTQSDIGAPVPGWGTSVRVAGPARLGVGSNGGAPTSVPDRIILQKASLLRRVIPSTTEAGGEPAPPPAEPPPVEVPPEASQVGGLPWYVWPVAAAVVLGGVGYYGTTKGWF